MAASRCAHSGGAAQRAAPMRQPMRGLRNFAGVSPARFPPLRFRLTAVSAGTEPPPIALHFTHRTPCRRIRPPQGVSLRTPLPTQPTRGPELPFDAVLGLTPNRAGPFALSRRAFVAAGCPSILVAPGHVCFRGSASHSVPEHSAARVSLRTFTCSVTPDVRKRIVLREVTHRDPPASELKAPRQPVPETRWGTTTHETVDPRRWDSFF